MSDVATMILTGIGLVFFAAGTLGLLRFPDPHSRLHALTKADNLGLGFIVVGLGFQVDGILPLIKLVLIWGLAILAAGTTSQLVARSVLPKGLGRQAPDARE